MAMSERIELTGLSIGTFSLLIIGISEHEETTINNKSQSFYKQWKCVCTLFYNQTLLISRAAQARVFVTA